MSKNTPTFQAVASRWLSELAGNVDSTTIEHYRWSLENYVYPELGERGLQEITEEAARNLLEKKRAEGLSEGSVYIIPKLIGRILSYASAEGLCEAPEWNIVMGKPKRMTPPVILTYDQENRLLTYLSENPKPKYVAIYLSLTTGISIGELQKLTWADVSLYQKRIRVLKEGKGTSDARNQFRIIPIIERQRIFLKKVASLPTVYVTSGKPKPASPYAIRDHFIRVLKALDLPDMPFSDLRRTFAVHCLEGGMGYEKLSQVLGQKNTLTSAPTSADSFLPGQGSAWNKRCWRRGNRDRLPSTPIVSGPTFPRKLSRLGRRWKRRKNSSMKPLLLWKAIGRLSIP